MIPPEAQWEWGGNVRELGLYAGEKEIDIALELEPFRLSLLNSVPEMVRFIDDVGLPNVMPTSTSHLYFRIPTGRSGVF